MLEGSGALLEALVASSPDAIVIVDEQGCIELASAAVEQLFGYLPSELVGQPVEILIPETVRGAHRHHREGYANHPTARAMGAGLELYGRRREGSDFPVDVSLSPLQLDGTLRTAAFVRDATERRRGESLMRDINDITREMLAGANRGDVLTMVCERAVGLGQADVSWVVVPGRGTADGDLLVAAAAGHQVAELVGAVLDPHASLSAQAIRGRRPLLVTDMSLDPSVVPPARQAGLGPGAYFPMIAQGRAIGALVVARRHPEAMFSQTEMKALEVFAAAAAVGLALGDAREALEDLRLAAEHERIGRDLHDTVIQRLFALGMRLQAAQRLEDQTVRERNAEAIRTIDEVIYEIRETIFDLDRPAGIGPDVRQQVRTVIKDAEGALGFSPRVSFQGPVDAAFAEPALSHVLSVLRESLSNVARHARATRVDIVVTAASDAISLTVADDGVGMPEGPSAGHGLTNLVTRAATLGGECSVTPRRPKGTLVQWRVPTARPSP